LRFGLSTSRVRFWGLVLSLFTGSLTRDALAALAFCCSMFANFQFSVQGPLLSASTIHRNNSATSLKVPSFPQLVCVAERSSCFASQFPGVSFAIRTSIHPPSIRYQDPTQARDLNSTNNSQQAQNCAMSLLTIALWQK
jgi:hypothetical protein